MDTATLDYKCPKGTDAIPRQTPYPPRSDQEQITSSMPHAVVYKSKLNWEKTNRTLSPIVEGLGKVGYDVEIRDSVVRTIRVLLTL